MEDKKQREFTSLITRLVSLLNNDLPYMYRESDNRYRVTYKKIVFYIQIRKINNIYFCDTYTENSLKYSLFAENRALLVSKLYEYIRKFKQIYTF